MKLPVTIDKGPYDWDGGCVGHDADGQALCNGAELEAALNALGPAKTAVVAARQYILYDILHGGDIARVVRLLDSALLALDGIEGGGA